MKQAVHFGAGNIGRGFIGALFSQSGYHVTFVDIAEKIIDQLNEKSNTKSNWQRINKNRSRWKMSQA